MKSSMILCVPKMLIHSFTVYFIQQTLIKHVKCIKDCYAQGKQSEIQVREQK